MTLFHKQDSNWLQLSDGRLSCASNLGTQVLMKALAIVCVIMSAIATVSGERVNHLMEVRRYLKLLEYRRIPTMTWTCSSLEDSCRNVAGGELV